MPYVLKQKKTGLIYSCMLVNHYGLAYYGVKFWGEHQEAEENFERFLNTVGMKENGEWAIFELEEREMKLCNVKLKNDPNYELIWQDTRKPLVRIVEN
ncbi:hypothetical protein [Paenibacillus sp. N3.4]|uniref:hypothetical protein n=1 Tax=Paenibacillus sp. N3.4 TaxID=2603222 RepID=UPI0011CA08F6|nr:hypothetical protein [Paenibacillus sp. N3.4]TXK75920.1 hypothetical protein FU659_26740 [Paenibacillus sp. N3.4]